MLDKLTKDDFAGQIGEPFNVHYGSEVPLAAELVEVTGYAAGPRATGATIRREPFSLVFRGPRAPVLPQRIYTLEHDAFGRLELFIVPIGPDATGMRYQVVFN
jgi:hypothetical protein